MAIQPPDSAKGRPYSLRQPISSSATVKRKDAYRPITERLAVIHAKLRSTLLTILVVMLSRAFVEATAKL